MTNKISIPPTTGEISFITTPLSKVGYSNLITLQVMKRRTVQQVIEAALADALAMEIEEDE